MKNEKIDQTFYIGASAKAPQPAASCPTPLSSPFFFHSFAFRLSPHIPFFFFKPLTHFSSTQGDLGGQRTLQKKWTSFLKAKLVCSMPELNFVFNVVHDVFILKGADWRDTVIYGVFTSQWSVSLFYFFYPYRT